MALAGDIGGAGLALGIKGVEGLLQAILGGFAGVDGAAADGGARHRRATDTVGHDACAPAAAPPWRCPRFGRR